MLKFDFINETGTKVPKKFFQDIVKRFYKTLKTRVDKMLNGYDGQVDLVLVGDSTIHTLNFEYRDQDEPTDVISFAYLEVTEFEVMEGQVIVGDIFISVDTAKRQSKEKKHSLNHEMEILFVHGLLHLFGFDHKNDKQEKEMEKWALRVLTAD
jgi:probable rRNA maturation factor